MFCLLLLSSLSFECTFVHEPSRLYKHHRLSDSVVYEVKLDINGAFKLTGNEIGSFYSGPAQNIMRRSSRDELVYELRSGMLILGNINDSMDFVPKKDSKITTFKDYLANYNPCFTPRIYNLPGRIVVGKVSIKPNEQRLLLK